MRFIRSKNLQETEELFYVPELHWTYLIRDMALSVPFFILISFFGVCIRSNEGFAGWFGQFIGTVIIYNVLKGVFLAVVAFVLLAFIYRIFQYMNTEYCVTNQRLIIKKGIIRLVVTEIPVERIESVHCVQGFLGRIFNFGTIRIAGVGGMTLVFFMVYRPFVLRLNIVDIIEKNKGISVVHDNLPEIKSPFEDAAATEE